MSDMTARFGLPFILPGQAQKELFHNEALARIDAALNACVEEGPLATPPVAPSAGQCWIVGEAPSGDWAEKAGAIAAWTPGGWRFVDPVPGMAVWDRTAGFARRWDGAGWSDGAVPAAALLIGGSQVVGERQPGVPNPSGGTIIDAEARTAIAGIIAALMSHGLIG